MNIIMKDDYDKVKDFINRIENMNYENESYESCRRNIGYILQFLIDSNITPFSSAQKFKVKMDKTYFNASNFLSNNEFPIEEIYNELLAFMKNYVSKVSKNDIFDIEFKSDRHQKEWFDMADYIFSNYDRRQYYANSYGAFTFDFDDELELEFTWVDSRYSWQVTLYYLDEDGDVYEEDMDINELELSTKELKDLINDGIKGRLSNWTRSFK